MKHKKRIVIYTAIFGKRDTLLEPKCKPPDCDFVCFTDQSFSSNTWDIRRVPMPVDGDYTRSNRYYKLHPHILFPDHDTSIYIDGNVLVIGDITELANRYLSPHTHLAGFDHAHYKRIPVGSLKEQLAVLAEPERQVKHKESVALMQQQMESYLSEGFPDDNGLLWTMTLIRHHHEPDVVEAMEAWWRELNTWSRRDQVSFNYVAWKFKLPFAYISLDGSENKYIRRIGHHLPLHRRAYAYMLAGLRRLKKVFA